MAEASTGATRRVEYVALEELRPAPRNPKQHALDALGRSVQRFGFVEPIVLDERTGRLVAGHGRVEHLQARRAAGEAAPDGIDATNGEWRVPVIRGWASKDDAEAEAYLLASNRLTELGGWQDDVLLQALRGLDELAQVAGFDERYILDLAARIAFDPNLPKDGARLLKDRFLVPPFTILDARQGYWQERRKLWLDLGIRSDEGRALNLLASSAKARGAGGGTGTSIFDPVMAEIAYRWFTPPGAHVLDPFCGGSVRGVVAVWLGHSYIGVDLRPEQIEANIQQWQNVLKKSAPEGTADPCWLAGDSRQILDLAPEQCDFVFSSPPYYDREPYSDLPGDLGHETWDVFQRDYTQIIVDSCARLRDHRFACFIVGEVRADNGVQRGFVPLTVEAFKKAGLQYYNEAVQITPGGSAWIRAARIFEGGRKLTKTHANVLVFVKGDPKRAHEECGALSIDVDDIAAAAEDS